MDKKLKIVLNKLLLQSESLQNYLSSYPSDKLAIEKDKESWSSLQICHHMILVERSSLAYLKKKMLGADSLKNATILTTIRFNFLKLFLRSSWKIKAPTVISSPNPQLSKNEIFEMWNEFHLDLSTFLEQIPPNVIEKEIFKHPMVGRLTIVQTLEFLYEHNRRHHRQIFKTLKQVSK